MGLLDLSYAYDLLDVLRFRDSRIRSYILSFNLYSTRVGFWLSEDFAMHLTHSYYIVRAASLLLRRELGLGG